MKTLSIDIETYSPTELAKSGVYRYAEDPEFEILLFGYSADDEDVRVIDLAAGEKLPEDVLNALTDNSVTKWAFNASFERVCLSRYLRDLKALGPGEFLDPDGWRCTMVWAAYLGLPLSLKDAGAALKLERQKLDEGRDLIRLFCKPCEPTLTNMGRSHNGPQDAPDEWARFKAYNQRDVETEQDIQRRLRNFPVPDTVWDEYHIDQEINDRGIGVDRRLVESAIDLDTQARNELTARMRKLTSLDNPNSTAQMKAWLSEHGLETDTLGKKQVQELLRTCTPELRDALVLRQQLAKSSVKKYQAMDASVCDDGRCRGMFQFYGANRTGRFSGRIVQLQNLPQNHMADLDAARRLVRAGDYDSVKMLYGSVTDVLSELIRTAFVPQAGHKFIVADYSAIEARVIAWLAGEQWRMDLFKSGGDIYCQSATQMFKVPVVKHGVNGHLRQRGKVAELACIAKDSLVLTDQGLIPIQEVTTDMKVWDGENWVAHEGVVYRGEREVISYGGLTATPDHLVWVEGQSRPIRFRDAATGGAHLVQSGNGRDAIRLGGNHQPGKALEPKLEPLPCTDKVCGLREDRVAEHDQSTQWKIKGMPKVFTAPKNTKVAGSSIDCSKTTVREPEGRRVSKLRWAWHKIWVQLNNRSRAVSDKRVWDTKQSNGDRQDRYEWGLRARKPSVCGTPHKLCQSAPLCFKRIRSTILAIRSKCRDSKALRRVDTQRDHSGCRNGCSPETQELANNQRTARLYDIRNAGPHHRFTVSNVLVHNCGYGGGVGALKAMGALEMGLKEEELPELVTAWRESNPNIVKLWWAVGEAAMTAIRYKTVTHTHGLTFTCRSGMLFITLPSGRNLSYMMPQIGTNRFGGESITYMGVGATKKWERVESYGPKFVENITQAVSRDVLCGAMKRLRDRRIVAHVHDELIIEADRSDSLEEICELMGRTPVWAEGLILRADGYECEYYQKD